MSSMLPNAKSAAPATTPALPANFATVGVNPIFARASSAPEDPATSAAPVASPGLLGISPTAAPVVSGPQEREQRADRAETERDGSRDREPGDAHDDARALERLDRPVVDRVHGVDELVEVSGGPLQIVGRLAKALVRVREAVPQVGLARRLARGGALLKVVGLHHELCPGEAGGVHATQSLHQVDARRVHHREVVVAHDGATVRDHGRVARDRDAVAVRTRDAGDDAGPLVAFDALDDAVEDEHVLVVRDDVLRVPGPLLRERPRDVERHRLSVDQADVGGDVPDEERVLPVCDVLVSHDHLEACGPQDIKPAGVVTGGRAPARRSARGAARAPRRSRSRAPSRGRASRRRCRTSARCSAPAR